MGNSDRAIRVIAALIIAGLYFANVINGTLAVIGLIISGIFILTSLVSFCPLYLPFKINTRKEK